MNHLKKLKEVVGKEHLYKKNHIVINDYEIDEEGLHLKATIEGKDTELLVPSSDAYEFFRDLLPIERSSGKKELEQTKADMVTYEGQQTSLKEMREQLLNINKELMTDSSKEKLARAKALNNNINTLINSLKLEFQVAKEIRRSQNK